MLWINRNNAKLSFSFSLSLPVRPPLFLPLTLMIQVLVAAFLFGLVCHAAELPASQWSSDEYKNLTLRRHRTCVENEQYLHQGLCCLNCQAGKGNRIK